MKATFQSTVLGKRKKTATEQNSALVLHLGSRPTESLSDASFAEQSDYESSSFKGSTSKELPILINGRPVTKTKRCFRCQYEGCQKAYAKPSRLEEHERSHTGLRPFICAICNNSYLRETHLSAHMRSHLPETARPFKCERDECNKRFWTSQHLKVHYAWHDGARPYKCNAEGCHQAFSKHHHLRAHICSEHAPPGTKAYQCEHNDCTKSFDTNQHLKTHIKTHDSRRYTCVHIGCLATQDNSPVYFPTWSALQSHIRTEHPAICLHSSCNGRTFANQGGLRAHLKLHEQDKAEMELEVDADSGDDTDQLPKKKRRGGEHGRDWKCENAECGKEFKSKKALTTHAKITHLGERNFICDYAFCGQNFGYKHLLRRHQTKLHQAGQLTTCPEGEPSKDRRPRGREATFDIDTITGNAYATRAQVRLNNAQSLRCPFPHLQGLNNALPVPSTEDSVTACSYVFSRGYDLRRHLNTVHAIVMQKDAVDTWVRQQKMNMKVAIYSSGSEFPS